MNPLRSVTFLVAASCLGPACTGSDDSGAATTTAPPTFACIAAIQVSGLTDGTPVPDARAVLDRLSDDRTRSSDERRYYEQLRQALEDLPDSESIDDALDDIDCPLE